MFFRPLLSLAVLVGCGCLVSSYRYDIVLNVVGERSLIEKASKAFLDQHVRKANTLKHIENVNLVFKNFSVSQTKQPASICDELFEGDHQKVDLILQVVDDRDDLQSGQVRSLAKRANQPMITVKKENIIREWESMSFDEYNSLIHFKSIQSILSTVVRDLIMRENLQSAAILMDASFGNQTPAIVEDLSFTKIETMVDCQNYSIDEWKAKLVGLRRQKIANYFVLANTFTINKFLEAFNQQQMFSKYIKVYAITLGNGKIRCISCKHATFYIIRPFPSKLHDYDSNENLFGGDAKNRIQLYFYYDLLRLITTTVDRYLKLVKELNSKNNLPVLDRAKCERHFRVQPSQPFAPDEPSIVHANSLPINNFDLSQNDLTENDPTVFSFRPLLAAQTEQLYGYYGDFKLHTDAITYGYQDIAMRIEQESYLRQQVTRESYAEWSFDEKEGNIFFNAHLLEEESEGQEVAKEDAKEPVKEEAKPAAGGGEEAAAAKSEEPKSEGGDEAKGEAKAEESGGGGGEAKGEEAAGEDGGGGGGDKKPKDNRVTVFLVEHPPFIMKRVIDRSKEMASTTTTTTTTTTAAPKEEGEEKEEEPEEPEEEEKKTEYEYYGFLIDLFEMIREELTAKKTPFPDYRFEEIEITKDSDKMFYGGDRKTDFSGMVKKMNETETDSFALAPLAITASREFLIEFSEPYFQNIGISILMKKPRRKPHFFKFITVLESKVWACITGAYLFTSILLAIFDQFNPQSYKKKKEAKMMLKNQPNEKTEEQDEYEALTTNRIFTFKESLWFCITSLTPQGGGEAPRSLYGRLVAATWWLFGFIVIASYTANLAAFLTVSRLETKIDDLKKLSKQYKVRYAPVDDTATDFYFLQNAEIEEKFYEIWKDMSLNDSLSEDDRAKLAVWDYPVSDRYTKIASQMSESDKPKGITNALKRVRESADHSDGFAILADSLTVEYFSFLFCDIYQVGESFAPRPMAFGAKKTNSIDIMKLINPIIVRLEEQGLIEDLKAKYWWNNDNRKNCEEFRKLSNGISLLNAGGVFIVIINGVILTLFVLVLENFIVVHMKVNRAKKQKAAIKPPLMMNSGKANSGFWKSFKRFFTGKN